MTNQTPSVDSLAAGGADQGTSTFPLSSAFEFALQGIRLRMGRMVLVFLGICLAMAFTGVLLVTGVLYKHLPPEIAVAGAGGAQGEPGAFRWMWLVVALLISTSGTLNAILMSVTERIKEIGTLKCLGAKSVHIVEIFLIESTLLGLLGGVVGGVLGYLFAAASYASSIGSKHLTTAAMIEGSEMIFVCAGVSTCLALLASVIPVVIAARIEPATAMRYEV